MKETVCPRTTQKSPEDCDFKEDGLVKRCVGTVILNQARDSFDISCDKVSGLFWVAGADGSIECGPSYGSTNYLPNPGQRKPLLPRALPPT